MLLITLTLAGAGFFAVVSVPVAVHTPEGDIEITDYHATLSLNGTLRERFVYKIAVGNRYRMLYRSWEVPVGTSELGLPSVQVLRIVSSIQGIYTYTKDHSGSIHLDPEDETVQRDVGILAELNEVGVFKPDYFDPGIYAVEYVFILRPPIDCDDELCHLNLRLASSHMAYGKVTITIKDRERIAAVYPHPPTLPRQETGEEIVIHGSSSENQLIEVELLLRKDAMQGMSGFRSRVEDVKGKTERANLLYSLPFQLAEWLRYATYLVVSVVPLSFLHVYRRHGVEKSFNVPRYLSFVPSKRKPWLVNMIFSGDVADFDQNGFYATILDLHARGKIKIEVRDPLKVKERGLSIQVLDPAGGEDDYERRVIRFFAEGISGGVFDTDIVNDLMEKAKTMTSAPPELTRIKDGLDSLVSYRNEKVVSAFAVSGRGRIAKLLPIPAALLFGSMILIAINPDVLNLAAGAAILSLVGIIQVCVGIAFPSTLFGRWNEDYYREKQEWDSFKNMLSDLAQVRRYAPEDLSIWGEWLIYGTALGVGDKVSEAMKQLHVNIPELETLATVPAIVRPVIFTPIRTLSTSNSRSGFGSGGFGAGGGFGGGGGGAR